MEYNSNVYSESQGSNWWKAPESTMHFDIFAHVNYLETSQTHRNADNIKNMRLYGNYDILGIDAYNYTRIESSLNLTHRVTFNIIASMIDTVVSKITKNKPKPEFLTEGGEWHLQQKAKKLTKYCEGIFYSTQLYREATRAFTDACIFGTGAIKFFKENNEIKAERILIDELKTDESESFYGKPSVLHQVKFIHKDKLKEMFPGNDASIDDALNFETSYSISKHYRSRMLVYVVESWHLPSSKDATDGKHTITIASKTLFAETYTKNYFPFVFFRWQERPVGFWGMGISEQLTGLQLEINKILKTIQVSMHLVSVPKLFVEVSSKVVTAHLNNKIGGVIKYAGAKPEYAPLGNIPPELFSHLDRLVQSAYQMVGVSQMSSQSQKPEGLDSGKALREFNDIETDRFSSVAVRYEQGFLDAAKIVLDLAKEISIDTKDFKVKVKGKDFVESIRWEEVDLEEDKYMMQVFPINALSNTPSARLEDVKDLIQAGFITQDDGRRLLDFPDLKAVNDLYNSGEEDINRTIDKLLNTGVYESPEPFQNLQLGLRLVQNAYLMYKGQNCPEEKLELLRQWISDAQAMLAQAAPPAPMTPAAPMAPPQATPVPVPQSPLMPQVPPQA